MNYRPNLKDISFLSLYTLFVVCLLPFLAVMLWRQKSAAAVEPDNECWQRLGLGIQPRQTGGWLFHCASVGEVVAASGLIKQLMIQDPELTVSVTTATPTGGQRVKQLFGDTVQHLYLPVDLPWCMARLLRALQPQKLIITEVELWPNLFDQCWRHQVPIYVVNARLTDRSRRRFTQFNGLFQPMLKKAHRIGAQGQRDFDNYLQAGIEPDKLTLTRNIKFDLQLSPTDRQKTQQLAARLAINNRPVLIAGSTHDPEEKLLIDAVAQCQKTYPDILLVLVPRHPKRFDQVFQLCEQSHLQTQRTSSEQPVSNDTAVLLADSLGMLKYLYGIADMAFIGGSIASRGGHNPLEAAIWGIPVLMGSSRFNNPEICAQLEQCHGLFGVDSVDKLTQRVQYWLANPAEKQLAGDNALQAIADNSGALLKTIQMLNEDKPCNEQVQ